MIKYMHSSLKNKKESSNTMTTIELEANPKSPEQEALVNKFKGLADMVATWAEANGAPTKTEEVIGQDGTTHQVEVHNGIRLGDIENFVQADKPGNSVEETQVQAARLFNRMMMETNGIPAPDDITRLDTSSYTATLKPLDGLKYAAVHMRSHLDMTDPSQKAELFSTIDKNVDRYAAALGSTPDSDRAKSIKDNLYEVVRNAPHPATEYPTLPEY
jgi:hypothetical protein